MNDRPELMTYQQAEDLKARFDRLIGLMGEEINLHPDTIYPTVTSDMLRIGTNSAILPQVKWEVVDRQSGRWLIMTVRDATGWPIMMREWRCVYRDLSGGPVIDRPMYR